MRVERSECCSVPSHCLQQYVECITEIHARVLLFSYLQQTLRRQGIRDMGKRDDLLKENEAEGSGTQTDLSNFR